MMKKLILMGFVFIVFALVMGIVAPVVTNAEPPRSSLYGLTSSCDDYLNCDWFFDCVGLSIHCEEEITDPFRY